MTLDEIRASATRGSFPVERLAGSKTALAFYCAAFLGRQDVVHLFDAGLEVIGVDTDEAKLREMGSIYGPPTGAKAYIGILGSAGEIARALTGGRRTFDVVTLDPWTKDVGDVLALLPLWCGLARRVVVAGITMPWLNCIGAEAVAPEPVEAWIRATFPDLRWRCVELRHRSDHVGGVYWAVLVPADYRHGERMAEDFSAAGAPK